MQQRSCSGERFVRGTANFAEWGRRSKWVVLVDDEEGAQEGALGAYGTWHDEVGVREEVQEDF